MHLFNTYMHIHVSLHQLIHTFYQFIHIYTLRTITCNNISNRNDDANSYSIYIS